MAAQMVTLDENDSMKSLRILLVMIEPPLPFGDAAARWFYVLLKGLVKRGHRVTAFATCSHPEQLEEAKTLFPSPDYDLRCYVNPERNGLIAKWDSLRRPYSYVFNPALYRDLEIALVGGFDVLHLEQLWSGWLGLDYADQAVINLHYLYEIDLANQPQDSLAERARFHMRSRAEKYLLCQYPTIRTLTPCLSARVRQISPTSEVHTVPLGIDLSLYPFESDGRPVRDPVVSLIGSFNWYPTYSGAIRLLTKLWPEIKRRVPHARLQFVGRDARGALRDFLDLPDVAIHENVPDIIPYFLDTDVLLYAPYRGSGMKVKILEAFALGVPVVTTSEGVEGLPAMDGLHASICEDDAGLIDHTVALIKDQERRQKQRIAARQLLESHCSPYTTLNAVEDIYAAVSRRCSVNRNFLEKEFRA